MQMFLGEPPICLVQNTYQSQHQQLSPYLLVEMIVIMNMSIMNGLKFVSQILQHRVDRQYYMEGTKIPLQGRLVFSVEKSLVFLWHKKIKDSGRAVHLFAYE